METLENRGRVMKKKLLVVMLIAVALLWSCASKSTVVIIEPGESVELIIVEPKKRWDWRSREKVRKEKKNDKEI